MAKEEKAMKRWYALYTKPRWEKKVNEQLQQRGYESYCPLNKVRKKWSDRFKLVDEPLFKSYVFVKLEESEKTAVRFVDGVVNYVYWLGKPAVVKQTEIDKIKKFLNEYTTVNVEALSEIRPGMEIIIGSGPLMDQSGVVVNVGKRRVEVELHSLGCKLVAFVEKKNVSLKV